MRKKAIHFSLIILFISLASFTTLKDSYKLDVGHTYVGFDVERFMVGEVSGRFNEFTANLKMEGDNYNSLELEATINVNSIDSNNKIRDGHLKSETWLYANKYPNIKFRSSKIYNKKNQLIMKGNFTIRGITKEVEFPIEVIGPFKDPTQKTTIGLKADFIINRFDYGINLSKKLSNGSYFIGKDVKIKIRALAIKN